jgi:hypothetical protein
MAARGIKPRFIGDEIMGVVKNGFQTLRRGEGVSYRLSVSADGKAAIST